MPHQLCRPTLALLYQWCHGFMISMPGPDCTGHARYGCSGPRLGQVAQYDSKCNTQLCMAQCAPPSGSLYPVADHIARPHHRSGPQELTSPPFTHVGCAFACAGLAAVFLLCLVCSRVDRPLGRLSHLSTWTMCSCPLWPLGPRPQPPHCPTDQRPAHTTARRLAFTVAASARPPRHTPGGGWHRRRV